MFRPFRSRSARSGVFALVAWCALGSLLAPLRAHAAADPSLAFSAVRSFSALRYPDGLTRQFLVKNGRVYRRSEANGQVWEDLSPLFNGEVQVGLGEITAYDVEVYQDGRFRMFMTRGGSVHRIAQREDGSWSAWKNIDASFAGVGSGTIASFSTALHGDGLLRQFLVRGGRVYRRTQQSAALAPGDVESWGAWTDITAQFESAGGQGPIRAYHSARYPGGNLGQFLTRGNRVFRRGEPNPDVWEEITAAAADPAGRSNDPRVHLPIYKRAMVIEFNPLIASQGGRPLHEVRNWRNPRTLEQHFVESLERASSQVVQYAVAQHVVVRAFPPFANAPTFTEAQYLQCTAAYPYTCPSQVRLDYARVLRDYQVCEKANAGLIDELWLMGGAFFGFWEANMAGPGAFSTNGPVVVGTSCNVKLNIMGFNYEREPERMLENMGHRIEGTLVHRFGQWRNGYQQRPEPFPADANAWEQFTARGFDYAMAACGNIHGSLNTPQPDPQNPWGYDYANPNIEPNTCDDWENYPALTGAVSQNDCSKWGCSDLGWHLYWLGKLPAFNGRNGTANLRNNWWAYVLDWDAAVQ